MLPIILAVSVGFSALFFSWGILTYIGMSLISIDFLTGMDYIVFGVLVGIGPLGFYNHMKDKRKREVEEHLPDFLRDIANSSASGMTIYDSIRAASQGDYGALTQELKMMASQLSWSIPVDEALTNFAKRINTDEVKRLAITINKALEIGGNTSSVFNAAAREIDQIKRVEQQRRTEMSMYSIVIFISFFVFLAVIIILNSTIFAALYELQSEIGGHSIAGMEMAYIDPKVVKDMLFTFVVVQSIGGGILGGFMMEGKLSSGVKQAFILILISFILFKLLF
jgi:flagellar protein FlaJ